jgi:hypothetical protein
MQSRCAGKIKEGLIDGERLDEGRQLEHKLAHLFANGGIFPDIRLNDNGLRAKCQGFEHRHGGFHAFDTCHIAGRGDNPAGAAADNNGSVLDIRIVALLDRCIEGIAINMGNGKLMYFRMPFKPRPPAIPAARVMGGNFRQAVTAKSQRRQFFAHAASLALNAKQRNMAISYCCANEFEHMGMNLIPAMGAERYKLQWGNHPRKALVLYEMDEVNMRRMFKR